MQPLTKLVLPVILLMSLSGSAAALTLSSSDISHNKMMDNSKEFIGFGCNGGNISPQLSWSGVPKGTEYFAIFAYDPDAPTGSGWWHWQVINIPKNVNSVVAGAGDPKKNNFPAGSLQLKNDFGQQGFGGVCPPIGHGMHRYQFTVYALSQQIELPENYSSALVGYMVNAYSLGSATLEALYKRD
ncbi:YbhB/YbcL family Raf kinase inhibitor-like protein [Serratia microhaemolytica]|uniref:YbhB/YbcL family Raf kinase inhibitor-like protein n=1 Tax=Serratia microhaemolytica TaxID=2675110 RepID=UPI000FDD27D3|nr:YbhB/YbcL family Raf kinase inhibitor-like protein [Serratia microhaemolytica]